MSPNKVPRFDWRWIGRSVYLQRGRVGAVISITALIYVIGLVIPICTQQAVDIIAAGHVERMPELAAFALLALIAPFVEMIGSRWRQVLIINLGTFIDRRVSRRAFAHFLRSRIDRHELRSGDIINRFQQATKIRDFIFNVVPKVAFDIGAGLIALLAMFYYDWPIGLTFLLLAPLVLIKLSRPIAILYSASEKFYKETGKRQDVLSETVNGMSTLKAQAGESIRMRRWIGATDAMLDSLRTLMMAQLTFIITTQFVSRVLTLLVIVIGCWQLLHHKISVGDLLALQLLSTRVSAAILQCSDLSTRYQEVNVAIKQVDELLAGSRESADRHPPMRRMGHEGVRMSNTSVIYEKDSRPALEKINVELPGTGVIGLVGRNGSGKSTFVKVLLGLQRNYSGVVQIGGHDLRNYDPRWLRGQFGVVDQDTILFSGSIRENLSSSYVVEDNLLREALRFADALDFVNALPDGLDTQIKEGGRGLSGGQRQRLSIARAIVRNPRMAFFDEPTAFLDAEAAVALEKRLVTWGQDRLLILVSHHLGVMRKADMVLVLHNGRLVGKGTHHQLLKTTLEYQSLWSDYIRNCDVQSTYLS